LRLQELLIERTDSSVQFISVPLCHFARALRYRETQKTSRTSKKN